jgi:hypothetical protein
VKEILASFLEDLEARQARVMGQLVGRAAIPGLESE